MGYWPTSSRGGTNRMNFQAGQFPSEKPNPVTMPGAPAKPSQNAQLNSSGMNMRSPANVAPAPPPAPPQSQMPAVVAIPTVQRMSIPQPQVQTAPVIDTQTPLEGDSNPWSYKDPITGQARPMTEEGFLNVLRSKLAQGVPLSAMDLSAVNLYAPGNQALMQAITDIVVGRTTTLNYTPGQQDPIATPPALPVAPMVGRPPVVDATKGYEDAMAAKAASGTLSSVDALMAQRQGNPALAEAINRAIAGFGWSYQPTVRTGVDPYAGQQQASVYDRPEMVQPPAQGLPFQVRAGGVSRQTYTRRAGGNGIYT